MKGTRVTGSDGGATQREGGHRRLSRDKLHFSGGRQSKTFVTLGGNVVAGALVAVEAAHIRHEYAQLTWNVSSHIPGIRQGIEGPIGNFVVVGDPAILGLGCMGVAVPGDVGGARGDLEGSNAADIGDQITVENIPLRRLQSADDIANTAAFLASDEAREITGDAINVGGGVVMD